MRNRFSFLMTLAVLAGFAAILAMNMAALFGVIPSKYISPNDVRGAAVEHNGLLYTLNFEQQSLLVDIINRTVPVSKEEVDKRQIEIQNAPQVSKIVIYRFNASDIEITPVAYVTKKMSVTAGNEAAKAYLVFAAPIWNPNGYLEESASDEMQKLLLSSYDH